RKHGQRSSHQDLDVEPEGPGPRVLKVKANHIVETNAAAPRHLPQTGNARLDFQNSAPMPYTVCSKFVSDGRTWSDKRHVPTQNIPELWNLIETGFAKELSHSRHARILFDFEDRLFHPVRGICDATIDELVDKLLMDFFIAIGAHGAEFEKRKCFAILAESLLPEKNRTFGTQFNRQRSEQIDRCEKNESNGAPHDVNHSLGPQSKFLGFLALGKIRIEGAVCGMIVSAFFPFLRKKVEGNRDKRTLVGRQQP